MRANWTRLSLACLIASALLVLPFLPSAQAAKAQTARRQGNSARAVAKPAVQKGAHAQSSSKPKARHHRTGRRAHSGGANLATFQVSPGCRVVTSASRHASLGDLHAGQSVRVRYHVANGAPVADRISAGKPPAAKHAKHAKSKSSKSHHAGAKKSARPASELNAKGQIAQLGRGTLSLAASRHHKGKA